MPRLGITTQVCFYLGLLDHAGGRLLDLPERGEKGGEEEKKEEKREGKEGKKGRKGRPLLDYYYPHALAEDQSPAFVLQIEPLSAKDVASEHLYLYL